MSKMSERYYVLCKKADQRVKNLQHLMIEWQRLVSHKWRHNIFDLNCPTVSEASSKSHQEKNTHPTNEFNICDSECLSFMNFDPIISRLGEQNELKFFEDIFAWKYTTKKVTLSIYSVSRNLTISSKRFSSSLHTRSTLKTSTNNHNQSLNLILSSIVCIDTVLRIDIIFTSFLQDEILAPTDPKDMDDLQTKQFLVFLRTYAAYFS